MKEGDGFLAKIMPATRILQSLASRGRIDQERIDDAEKVIEEGKEAYADYFEEVFKRHIREMEDYRNRLVEEKNSHQVINLIASSIAKFRADSSMIGQKKYLRICTILLSWVESIKRIDDDAKDVLDGYLAAIKKKKTIENLPDDGIEGFATEMDAACRRYFEKHKEVSLEKCIDNSCHLYINEHNHDYGPKEELEELDKLEEEVATEVETEEETAEAKAV